MSYLEKQGFFNGNTSLGARIARTKNPSIWLPARKGKFTEQFSCLA